MTRLFSLVLLGIASSLLLGCVQSSQPNAVAPGGAAPAAGVVAVPSNVPEKTVLEKAGVGSGKKGRSLDKHEGIVVTPAKTLFAAKEKIKFEIEIPHTLNLYKALEGSAPKSHDEFMEKIIKANNISLPELPEGHKYVYDPMTETLMVEKPAP
ncbi:MAG: hypothetical protein ACKVP0_00675 [Pirellulaceae bacterium]